MIGYANFDINAFLEWNEKYTPIKASNRPGWKMDLWQDYFYTHQNIFNNCEDIMEKDHWANSRLDDFKKLFTHLADIGEKPQLFYYDDTACIIGYENRRYLMNSQFVTPEYLEDYSKISAAEMKALTGTVSNNSFLPAELDQSTVESLSDKKATLEKTLADTKAEIAAQEDKIRQEMYKKIEEMKTMMAGKLDELHDKIEQCQKEIFVLESQIFSIRCYTGEVIKFHAIRSGKPAPAEEPLVLYQKIRFLDEELGKHISIFDFDGEDDKRLIPLLKNRDDIAGLLAPGNKSLTILRTSRTGKYIAAHDTVSNILDEYDMYHGMQLALLLRDGENLYIAWCDADNIKINEENAFYSTTVKTEQVGEHEESAIHNTTTNIHEVLSRYYLLAILQGMIDAGEILKFPKPVNVMDPAQKYIIYSLAEGWVTSSKYGSFADMMQRSANISLKKDDRVITLTGLRSENSYKSYDNDRGIGYANRTHDIGLRPRAIYPINLVLYDAHIEYEYEALKIQEELSTRDILVTRNGMSSIEQEPDIKYTVTDEVLFTSTATETINFEEYRNIKQADISNYLHDVIGAVGGSRDVEIYQKDDDGRVRYYHKPDFWHAPTVQVSGKTLFAKRILNFQIVGKTPHTFVSIKQQGYGSYANNFKSTEYHVNFEIMPSECLSTTFLCTSWLDEVIQTGNTGTMTFINVRASFADMLPYLHKMREDIAKREKQEKEFIIQAGGAGFITCTSDWDAKLCDWKIATQTHRLTAAGAKKFLKALYANLG